MYSLVGYCEHHGREVFEDEYEWKGCWNCRDFVAAKEFPYIFVKEASELLRVSETTIRRWIKKGKLKGRLFVKGRREFSLGPIRKYHIKKESLQELARVFAGEKEAARS